MTRLSKTTRRTIAVTAALALVGGGVAVAVAPLVAGPSKDGTATTPTGQRVTPWGIQTVLGDLPLNSALSPDGKRLLVTNNGQGTQSIQLIDTDDHEVEQTLSYPSPESLYVGLAWSPDGTKAYASAAANAKIRTYTVDGGKLTEGAPLAFPTKTPDGKALNLYPAGLAVTPDGRRLVVADQLGNAVSVVDTATGEVQTAPAGSKPFAVALSPNGKTAYVTNQGASDVSVVDVSGAQPAVVRTFGVGLHPNKATISSDGSRLYVANGDEDSVSAVDTATGDAKTISLSPYADAPVGTNPTGLALDEKGGRLFVANSGNNDVAVVDIADHSVSGVIPSAWYPSSLAFRGGTLHVTNAKGLGAGPNDGPGHPDPTSTAKTAENQYSGSMIKGTLSSYEVPTGGQLQKATEQVKNNNRPATTGVGAVVPSQAGGQTPIKHVIYVVKENRTYDQVLGNIGQGNGDPALNLFGDDSAPNIRALAKRFTTIDNFYADAEVSANGWNWVTQANSNPYAEQMWPANYSGRKAPYPSENSNPENAAQDPSNSYVWQRLDKAGVSFRNYGFFVNNTANGAVSSDPVLNAKTDKDYRGYDLKCPDSSGTFAPLATNCGTPRVDQWVKDFGSQISSGTVPTVQFVRLPNDHTQGTKAGAPTPQAYVADNDYALGRLVDTVSHSPIWKDTAIFVTEDDAQNGPDHVDAHRTLALVISPYTQTGKVDSTFYSTASMVRTIGLLAGFRPLTQFDAYATPMSASFTANPRLEPYTALRPTYPMTALNGSNAPMAAQSSVQDLSGEDRIDERTFNEAIWKSVKGADLLMPEPQHTVIGSGSTKTGSDPDGDGR
ncbi:bifunctional YncE family protein/alkaline phosphatase family protein [Sinomonas notoginsengisoli]|uniref:bifunctional YncE family protein/alkaline phosphatase family protein n=1 Tax=Sinomonas notoginsengisoli TaxID=1457311 RepID=UPI001F20129B|nr:alkaline phosphatase family protein [Sinomonas notoginsengisoli]